MLVTITEAVAEVKRIEQIILTFLLREEPDKDPLANAGGSAAVPRREWQSLHALGERKLALRRAPNGPTRRATVAQECDVDD